MVITAIRVSLGWLLAVSTKILAIEFNIFFSFLIIDI